MTLIAEYRASAEFKRLAPSTTRAYLGYIKLIEDEFGDLPLDALDDLRMRGEFKAWRDRYANRPRTADYLWTCLARILSFSKGRGLIRSNPCERNAFTTTDRMSVPGLGRVKTFWDEKRRFWPQTWGLFRGLTMPSSRP